MINNLKHKYYPRRFANITVRILTLGRKWIPYSFTYCDHCEKWVKRDHEHQANLVATGLRGIKKAKVRYRFKSKKTMPDTIDYRPIFNEAGYYPPDQGNQGCYSADTQILTSDGWKCFPEVTDKETLATLNMDGEIEYHP